MKVHSLDEAEEYFRRNASGWVTCVNGTAEQEVDSFADARMFYSKPPANHPTLGLQFNPGPGDIIDCAGPCKSRYARGAMFVLRYPQIAWWCKSCALDELQRRLDEVVGGENPPSLEEIIREQSKGT